MYCKYIKRLIDVGVSLIVLPLILLITIIFSPVIYFEDRGPVFYNALRTGRYGERFKMYKFRSMRVDSPDIRLPDGSTYNADDDCRVTRIGRFMRKTSLDELPQFLNVLKGDMSLVGPRPILADRSIDDYNALELRRLDARPGITGYSQAYFRNSIGQREKFEHDVYYVDNISFCFDIKILLKTFLSVFRKENVYISSDSSQ